MKSDPKKTQIPIEVIIEIAQLYGKIRRARYLYYILAQPIDSDYEYDTWYRRLEQIEAEYPVLVNPESPTQLVEN